MAKSNIEYQPLDGPLYEEHRSMTEDWAAYAERQGASIMGVCSPYMIELEMEWRQDRWSWQVTGIRRVQHVMAGGLPQNRVHYSRTTITCKVLHRVPNIQVCKQNWTTRLGTLTGRWEAIEQLPAYYMKPVGSKLPDLANQLSFWQQADDLKLQRLHTIHQRQLHLELGTFVSSGSQVVRIASEVAQLAIDLAFLTH